MSLDEVQTLLRSVETEIFSAFGILSIRLSGTALAGSRPACAIAQGAFRMFPKLQQDSYKYYRSIDSVGNKILSVALGGKANLGKGRRNDGNVSTNEIAV